jgi:argininosuccinate lyase
MKLWQKTTTSVSEAVEKFTAGQDRVLDLYLAQYDVQGSMAHIRMLEQVGLLSKSELDLLLAELEKIHAMAVAGDFIIEEGVEDVHSQVELLLTRALGDTGKKIHSGRSRNDQVLTAIKLFFRQEIKNTVAAIRALFDLLLTQSEALKHHLLPGYTHLQVAMPSSFGLWLGAYAESLADDVMLWQGTYRLANKNPLGSAAGYGSSFPLNRQLTTALLQFETMHYNSIAAQMSRGKTERAVAQSIANTAATLNKLATDCILYMSQNFGFIRFPDELTTGSSIMPHKKNPDVFELIRARCNRMQSLPNEVTLLTTNQPSGYQRDYQLLKEIIFPAFGSLRDCLQMMQLMISNIRVQENILDDEKYKYVFSVETVNRLVLQGIPFREAYRQVGEAIEAGSFHPDKSVHHTHAGSIGNLCTQEIRELMERACLTFEA